MWCILLIPSPPSSSTEQAIYTYHRPPPINAYFHEAISGINNWNFIMQLYSVITYDEIDIMNVNLGWWGEGEGC